MAGATSGYKGNTLENQVQGVSGYAPSNLGMVGDYFKRFQPDTRMPMQTVGQQYRAFAPQMSQPLRHTEGPRGLTASQMQRPEEEWVDVPAMNRLGFSVGSATTRVKKNSNAAQMTPVGVVGY